MKDKNWRFVALVETVWIALLVIFIYMVGEVLSAQSTLIKTLCIGIVFVLSTLIKSKLVFQKRKELTNGEGLFIFPTALGLIIGTVICKLLGWA